MSYRWIINSTETSWVGKLDIMLPWDNKWERKQAYKAWWDRMEQGTSKATTQRIETLNHENTM